jgi:hypothetical protein
MDFMQFRFFGGASRMPREVLDARRSSIILFDSTDQ